MLSSRVLTICSILYQVQGAPQFTNPPWFHPSSLMNIQVNPDINAYPQLHSPISNQELDMGFLVNRPDILGDEMYKMIEYETEPGDFGRGNNGHKCPPGLFRRSSCLNTTTVRMCTFGGIYRDVNCTNGFSCFPTLGICVPQFTRRLPSFVCPESPGIYPDPRNCMIYYNCSQGSGSSPATTSCVWPQIYDPVTQSCQMESFERPCYKINCIGQQAVAYPGDPNIYANCTRTGGVQQMNKCLFGYGYNEDTQQCESPYCIQEGNIASDIADNQYYTCSRIFRRLIKSELKTCPGSTIFNATLGICAPQSPQARIPSHIVETLYHELPTVDDLIRSAQVARSPETKANAHHGLNNNRQHMLSHSFSNEMPVHYDKVIHGPPQPSMFYPNMMPYGM